MSPIRKAASYLLLVATYAVTWLVAVLGRVVPRRRWKPSGRIAVTGTIFNPNWYLSHITPLTRSGVEEVILIIDEPMQPTERVRFVCPPKWLAKLVSRAGAKAIWMLYVGIRYRPDLFMGYNLVAGGCTALIVGSLLGRPACYQMTGGQRVLSTISADVEAFDPEKVSKFRRRVSSAIERLAVRVIRCFDLIVVRGNKGKAFLAGYGVTEDVAIITGSVKEAVDSGQTDRSIDVVFVGRLNPIKQVDQFVEIIDSVSNVLPNVKAAIVGDGPLMDHLKADVERRKLTPNIQFLGKRKDVEAILGRSRVFVLTSKSEGSSIAMAEAMSMGTVPVVADVGELADLVHEDINGYVIEPNAVARYVAMIVSLLNDEKHWRRLSRNAIETARGNCHIDVVSDRWRRYLQGVVERDSATRVAERTSTCASSMQVPTRVDGEKGIL